MMIADLHGRDGCDERTPALYIPGSQDEGLIDDFRAGQGRGGQHPDETQFAPSERMVNSVASLLRLAGPGWLFMHCNLVHGSSANISPRSRTLFYVNVNSVENPQTTFARAEYHAGSDFSPIKPAEDRCLLD